MVDHATRKTTINRLEEAISWLTIHHESLVSKHSSLATKGNILLDRLNQLTTIPPTLSPFLPQSRPHIKLEVPRFDDHDPLERIFKISQFFDYQGTPKDEFIIATSFYMDGLALSWFQWMSRNGFIT